MNGPLLDPGAVRMREAAVKQKGKAWLVDPAPGGLLLSLTV